MKNLIYLFLILGLLSCDKKDSSHQTAAESENSELNTADCDDKIEQFKEKPVTAEISLDAPQDEGCTLE